MVECHLAKVKVAGPNPVSRSTQKDSRKEVAGPNPVSRSTQKDSRKDCLFLFCVEREAG